MITKPIFRVIVVVAVLSALFSVFLSLAGERLLPVELQYYLQRAAAQEAERGMAILALGIPILVVSVVVAVGLFLFWPWSRPLALIVTVASVVFTPVAGPIVESGWVGMFSELSSLLWGAVLASAYWSPIKDHFVRKAEGT